MTEETEATPKPELTIEVDGYRLSWATGIEAMVERLSEHRDELTAEVTITSIRSPRPGLLHRARLNLMSSVTRKALANALSGRDHGLDWAAMLEQLCFLVTDKYRTGDPAIDLRTYTPPMTAHWLIEPFVERGGPTILFADGGTGKSMLALAMAVTVASGIQVLPGHVGRLHGDPVPVLYCDWETDAGTVHKRTKAIAAGTGIVGIPEIHYRRQVASLKESAPELRRELARVHAGFVVIDSFGAARGGEPESADITIQAFNAVRTLGVPVLIIDHVTKSAGNESTRPFGSAYTHNLARVTWGLDRSEHDGSPSLVWALMNRKWNDGQTIPKIGLRADFDVDTYGALKAVTFKLADMVSAGMGSMNDKILRELEMTGPQTLTDLTERVAGNRASVRARLSELKMRGKIIEDADEKYALPSKPQPVPPTQLDLGTG